MMQLKDKVAVITGGAQGIGRAICLGMAREGASVVVADLQADKAKSVVAELQVIGAETISVEVNVANEISVKRLAEQTFERFGRIDILVNDAGVYLKAPVVNKNEADWDRTLRPGIHPLYAPTEERQNHQSCVLHRPYRRTRICRLCRLQGGHHRFRQGAGA
jgi:NAD(P)-dependent dehydrogenase (short-subunit alcohol dehydrogenase family)